jgi:hypothetical protein
VGNTRRVRRQHKKCKSAEAQQVSLKELYAKGEELKAKVVYFKQSMDMAARGRRGMATSKMDKYKKPFSPYSPINPNLITFSRNAPTPSEKAEALTVQFFPQYIVQTSPTLMMLTIMMKCPHACQFLKKRFFVLSKSWDVVIGTTLFVKGTTLIT